MKKEEQNTEEGGGEYVMCRTTGAFKKKRKAKN